MTVRTVYACPVCDGRMVVRKRWLSRCAGCGFLLSQLQSGGGAEVPGLTELRRANFARLLDAAAAVRPLRGLRLLEVGCAGGLFLEAAAARGIEATAIEPDGRLAAEARAKGFDVREGYFPAALASLSGSFDAVAFNDSFEHLPDPVAALQAATGALAPGGLLVLNLPCSTGILYRIADAADRFGAGGPLRRLWQVGMSSPHISYFSRTNLRRFCMRYTGLALAAAGTLPSVSRVGLRERVLITERGGRGMAMFCAIYAASFTLPALPGDIQFQIWRKQQDG